MNSIDIAFYHHSAFMAKSFIVNNTKINYILMKRTFLIKMTNPLSMPVLLFLLITTTMCKNPQEKPAETNHSEKNGVEHPEWTKDAIIYELNVRQYSEEGTFAAVTEDIQRLSDLGIDIIWLMPVHPIGEKNKKGELGSYYSVRDYRDVNPEFGSMEDFKELVRKSHEYNIRLILDWVPNHSAWDNPLAEAHPEWYVRDEKGEFLSPFDWTDVIQFDYENAELREYMTESLKFWIQETGVDGYRFDVAHMVPVDFWDDVRIALQEVKEDVFMLAEADQPFLHKNAMNMSYDWRFHHIMNEVASGNKTAVDIQKHFAYVDTAYPEHSILMQFTSNHDENSWNGTVYERYGESLKTFAVLSFAVPGMPLIYNGQEACMDKRLLFFERDPIEWKDCELFGFYQQLIRLRKDNPALWSANWGAAIEFIEVSDSNNILAFKREKGSNSIVALFNFSDHKAGAQLNGVDKGLYTNYFSRDQYEISGEVFELLPWDYKIFVRE